VAEEKGVSIYTEVPKDLLLVVDRNKIQQVIANLLDNAIKYTSSGGRVDIQSFQKDHQVVITIRDTGIGIPKDELPKIWNRLYRGEKSRSQRGLGLGLSLIKPIIEVHRGSIEVSSEPDQGSTFTLYLPINFYS
jgi:signal transduction histidine kinase